MNEKKEWKKPEITVLFEGEVQEHVMAFRISIGQTGDDYHPENQ